MSRNSIERERLCTLGRELCQRSRETPMKCLVVFAFIVVCLGPRTQEVRDSGES